jgi:squamous cell carcinoma antigen recognized by T-cells 3
VKHWSGKSRGYGYVDFDTQQNAIEALKLDRTPISGRPMFVSPCEDKSLNFGGAQFKYATNLEKNKLFVANLPFSVDKAQLEDIFKNVIPYI